MLILEEKLESNLSRFVVIIWLFVVLILTSSYTASLTSMLTVQRLQSTATSVQDLLRNGDYVGYQKGSIVEYWLEEMGFHKENLLGYSTMEEYADALWRGSDNGVVSAIFDEIPYLKVFLSKYCEGYTMVGPTYRLGGFGFAFPIGSPMVHDVWQAFLSPEVQEEMERIEKKWSGDPGTCQSKSSSIDSSRLSFSSFSGLFLISGIVSGLVLLIHLAIFVYRERDKLRAALPAGTWKALLQRLYARLQRLCSMCVFNASASAIQSRPSSRGDTVSERNGNRANQLQGARLEAAAMRSFTVTNTSKMNASSPEIDVATSLPEEILMPEF